MLSGKLKEVAIQLEMTNLACPKYITGGSHQKKALLFEVTTREVDPKIWSEWQSFLSNESAWRRC